MSKHSETAPMSDEERQGNGVEVKSQPDIAQGQHTVADVPPDGGYGWVCVACVFWINAHTWGINGTYGVFLSYYLSNNVFPGTSALFYAFTGGLGISVSLLVAPLATVVIHMYGNRVALHVGTFFQTGSLIAASFAKESWQLLLSQGVCFGVGMGFLFIASVGITPQWFAKKRSVANGIASSGCGIGGLIYSLGTSAMLQSVGVAWSFRILAIVSFVVCVIGANVIKDRNKAIGSRYAAFHLPLLAKPQFLLLLLWGVLSMLGYVALLFSLPNFAQSIGLSSHQGSIVGALHNLGQGLGRPVIGYAGDRCGRLNSASIFTFLTAVFIFLIWFFARSLAVLCVFAILAGTVSGTFWATVSPILVEVIGLQDLPGGLSIMWLALVAPCTVSEAIALELRQPSRGVEEYLRPQIFIGVMYVGAAVCLWVVRGWKVGDNAFRAQEVANTSQSTIAPSEEDAKADASSDGRSQSPAPRELPLGSSGRHSWRPDSLARSMVRWQWA